MRKYDCWLLSHFSCVQLFGTLGTMAHQAPLFMEFSSQQYWSGLPFPSPGSMAHTKTDKQIIKQKTLNCNFKWVTCLIHCSVAQPCPTINVASALKHFVLLKKIKPKVYKMI